MAVGADPGELLSLASALPFLVLGLLLLLIRPRRTENATFAAFAIAWGAQITAANLARLTEDARLHDALFATNLLLLLPTAIALAYFAALHPHRTRLARDPRLAALLVLLAVPALVVFFARPDWVVASTQPVSGRLLTLYGPAVPWLFFGPFYLAFYAATLRQFRAARTEAGGVAAQRARMVTLALGLFVSYASTRQFLLWTFPTPSAQLQTPGVRLGFAALFGLGLLLVLALAALIVFRPRLRGDIDVPLLLAFLLPMAAAGLERLLQVRGFPVETLGFWRLGTVALVVYAIARYELFDLDLRLRRIAVPATPLALAAVTIYLLAAGLLGNASPVVLGGTFAVGGLATGGAWVYRSRIAAVLLPSGGTDPDYLYHRKLEVYRASLEQAFAERKPVAPEAEALRQLRRQLGLSEREHVVLEFMVRRTQGARGSPEDAPARAEPGAKLHGRYRIERLLGEGAHGRAYLAFDEREDREVVVKAVGTSLLGGRAARMLLREARLAGALRHPNIIRVFDAAEGAQEALIVMEYADGGSLYGLLQRRSQLGLEEAGRLLDEVLAGLDAAHATGVVHRDIKPENLLLTRDGAVKLADFGVARELRSDATVGMTQGAAMGTLLYMSPEQVRGKEVDARSDLYAAAVVFHQALTGRFYLRVAGRDDFQIRQLILRGAPQFGKDLPEPVRAFLARALAKDPAKRYASAADMRRGLRDALGLKTK